MLVNLAPGRLRRDKHGRRPHVSGGVVQNEIKLVGRKSRRQLDNYGLKSPQTAVLALPPVRSQSIAEEEVPTLCSRAGQFVCCSLHGRTSSGNQRGRGSR